MSMTNCEKDSLQGQMVLPPGLGRFFLPPFKVQLLLAETTHPELGIPTKELLYLLQDYPQIHPHSIIVKLMSQLSAYLNIEIYVWFVTCQHI